MGPVHQTLGGVAVEHPGKLGNLRNVRLPIEQRLLRIQAKRQPGRRNFLGGAAHHLGILALDQGMVIGAEKERLQRRVQRCRYRGTDSAHVITEVGSAGSRYTGEYPLFLHTQMTAWKKAP